jgi:N-acetylmuramoyl-L-alanine amidase
MAERDHRSFRTDRSCETDSAPNRMVLFLEPSRRFGKFSSKCCKNITVVPRDHGKAYQTLTIAPLLVKRWFQPRRARGRRAAGGRMKADFSSRRRGRSLMALAICLGALGFMGSAGAAPRSVAGVVAPPMAQKAANVAAPVAIAAHVAEEGAITRLSFDLSVPVAAQAFVLADPDRLIVDLPEVNFQIEPDAGVPERPKARNAARKPLAGLVSSFRFGLLAPGKSRIVVDLAQPARAVRVEARPIAEAGGPARLVIELQATDRAAFRAAAAQNARRDGQGDATQRAPQAPAPRTAKPVIVLDPGHGGVDAGAIGAAHAIEKTIVFDFARLLAAQLEASGRFQVVMTRRSDVFVALDERVRIARAANAALFVSIHADMLHDGPSVTGATVYTVSDRASDAEAARIAEQENQADAAAGHESDEALGDVADILFDLTRRETRTYSHVFARALVDRWKQAARINKNPQRSAGFRVLKAPDVPSVLLELGYLSNPKDVEDLVSPEWRARTATTLARTIVDFFAARAPEKADAAPGVDPVATGSLPAQAEAPPPQP